MKLHGTCRSGVSVTRCHPRPMISNWKTIIGFLVGLLAVLAVGCSANNSPIAPTSAPDSRPDLTPTTRSTISDAPATSAASPSPAPPSEDSASPVTVTITEGSVARYLVREQLANIELPIDAIGQTSQVSGAIAFDPTGKVVSEKSRIVVDLTSLTSDEDRRDNYLRTRSLESNEYPTAEFVVRETPGLEWPLPTGGEASFQLVGDMTLHGVTRPLTWEAMAQFDNSTISGQAKTNFTFEEFDLEVPRVRILLSVDNNIRLELALTASVS